MFSFRKMYLLLGWDEVFGPTFFAFIEAAVPSLSMDCRPIVTIITLFYLLFKLLLG